MAIDLFVNYHLTRFSSMNKTTIVLKLRAIESELMREVNRLRKLTTDILYSKTITEEAIRYDCESMAEGIGEAGHSLFGLCDREASGDFDDDED